MIVSERYSCLIGPVASPLPLIAVQQVVQIWRKELSKINAKAAESLADPAQYANLFPDFDLALKAEQHQRQQRSHSLPASDFPDYEGSTLANLIEGVQSGTSHVDIYLVYEVLSSRDMVE